MQRGAFVTFEGVEGCGKSTQIELLAAYLRSRGVEVVATREPGGTELGEALRSVLLDPAHRPVPLAELLMLEAARAQLVSEVVEPALAAGRWVLSDRFADSSTAYQGEARGLGIELVERLNATACGALRPDRTVLLDMPVEPALSRARGRASTTAGNRRFEDEELAFHEAVAAGYRRLALREPQRFAIIDATGSRDETHQRVLAALWEILP